MVCPEGMGMPAMLWPVGIDMAGIALTQVEASAADEDPDDGGTVAMECPVGMLMFPIAAGRPASVLRGACADGLGADDRRRVELGAGEAFAAGLRAAGFRLGAGCLAVALGVGIFIPGMFMPGILL